MMEEAACQLERDHVHSVYDKIAPYFNDSRYKAWPKVQQFLLSLEPGSILADIGCGNGKYFHINKEVFKLGCDVCRPLVDFASSQGHEVQMCDCLHLPYRDGCFDAVLSIAVIHHLSTKERRIRAIKEMSRILRVGGHIMIYVWAMEQKRRKFEKQDIFVPWNLDPQSVWTKSRRRATAQRVTEAIGSSDKHRKIRSTSSVTDEEEAASSTAQHRTQKLWFFSRSLDSVLDFGSLSNSHSSSRDLSLFATSTGDSQRGRGRALIKQFSNFFSPPSVIGSEEDVFESDQHEDQTSPVASNSTEKPSLSLSQECNSVALPDLVSVQRSQLPQSGDEIDGEPQTPEAAYCTESSEVDRPCLRYYHVFREGELAQLIQDHIQELHVTHTYLDHANWCVVAKKVQLWNT